MRRPRASRAADRAAFRGAAPCLLISVLLVRRILCRHTDWPTERTDVQDMTAHQCPRHGRNAYAAGGVVSRFGDLRTLSVHALRCSNGADRPTAVFRLRGTAMA